MRSFLVFVFSALVATVSSHAVISFYLPAPNHLSDAPFAVNAGYLVQNIWFEPINELKTDIERELALKLIDRGEAHITVISPPEFSEIKNYVSMAQINALAEEKQLQTMPFTTVCVGSREITVNSVAEQTFYVVLKSPALLDFRRLIHEAAKAKGYTGSGFNAELYYPHITIGYINRDLHAQDGAIKDTSSCVWYLFK